jgi:hypothetical protein
VSTPPADGPDGGWRAPEGPNGWGPAPGAPGPPAPAWGAAPGAAPTTQPGMPPGTQAGTQPGIPQGAAPQGWGQLAGPGQQPYGSVLTRRGIIALKPLGFGDFFDGAFRAIRHNPKVMIGLTALVLGVTNVLVAIPLAGLVASPAFTSTDPDVQLTDSEVAGLLGSTLALIPLAFLQSMALVVLTGILILSVAQSVVDRRLSIGQVWQRARGRAWTLIGWSLLLSLGTALGFAVAAAPGLALLVVEEFVGGAIALVGLLVAALLVAIWLGIKLTFVPVLIVVERLGIGASVRRSFALTKGAFWWTFLILLLSSILAGAVSQVLTVPFSVVGSLGILLAESNPLLGGAIYVVTIGIGTTVGLVITTPFFAAVVALLYIDRRIRLEGLDVALAHALDSAPEDRPA